MGLGATLTHAKTVDDTADDHLWQMPRNDLKDGANSIANEAKRDGLFAAELVAEGEGEDGTAESAELNVTRVSRYVSEVPAHTRTEKQLDVMPEMLAWFVSGK